MVKDGVEARLCTFFEAEHHGAAAVYLFGSEARGEATPASDVDVGVLFAVDPPRTYDGLPLALEGALERLLGRATQVVALNYAPVDLRARVLRDGVLVLDRDPSARIGFEVQTRNEWFDLEPILREYRGTREAAERGR
jgi:predicted nucleotidyltransferase